MADGRRDVNCGTDLDRSDTGHSYIPITMVIIIVKTMVMMILMIVMMTLMIEMLIVELTSTDLMSIYIIIFHNMIIL